MTEQEKREKVIKGLECISNGAKQPCRDCEYSKREEWCIAECAKDALALLKAQEPVEPIQDMVGDALFWVCGKCGHDITSSDWYCANCGRAVKWND